ncbi:Prodigiosin synthesizing transferase PigC [Nymphon striatum]|nr:Prodigiosin synthesizing transferase PigC [Nymphon striatum]
MNLDIRSRDFGNITTNLQWRLESPISFTSDQKLDEVRLTAVNVNDNSILDICVARRSVDEGECWFYFQVNCDGQMKRYTLPKTHYNMKKSKDSCWAINDIKIWCLEPLFKWRISYNGLLRWKTFSTVRDHLFEVSNYSLAEAQAYSKNYNEPKLRAVLDQYDQWGVFYGTYSIDSCGEKELYLRGNKSRFTGGFHWSSIHRFIQVKVYVDDGRTVSFNAVSFDEDMPLMIWGYVDLSIGIEHPITKTDFCLETVNDVKQLPELISIRLSTVADEYILDLAVEQVNGSECLWGNNNTIWVNCNKVTAMLTNVTQGFTAKGMGSSHFYRNNYSVSNEDIPNRVVEKCLEFPGNVNSNCELFIATGEDTKADILSFSEVACGDEKLTGGKGSSLALLKSISNDNFNVPGGFCITITGNRKHINAFEHLKIAIDALTKKCSEVKLVDVQDQCERIGKLFEESELSFNLKSKIISCLKEQFGESYQQKKFAVRSSAAGEDGDEISGAGQMETFLGCLGHEMIFRAVKKCWASCFSFKAVEYRRQYGQIIDVGMCVVVQEMVAADIAGVLFTRDPITGNPGVINISANYGLGESVVSASSDPDNIIVNRDPENYLEIKNEGDVKEVETIKINRTECCLTHDQALKLAEICIKIESNYGDPRDIEWAIKENEIYLLQARPITSLDNMSEFELEHEFNTPLLTDKVMFTSGNIREVIPGAVSPLTQSFIMDKLSVGLSTLRKLFVPQLTFHPTFVRTNSTWKWSRFLDRIEICYSRNEKNPTVNTKNFNKGFDLAFNGRPIDDSQISEVGLRRYGYRSYFRSCQGAIKMLRNVSRTEKNLKEMQSLLGNFELNISNYCNLEELWNTVISNTGFLSESVNKHMAITLSSVISNTQIFVELLGADPEFTDKHYADFATLMAIDSSSEHVESADVPLALKVKAFSCLTVIEEIEFFSKFAKSLANEIAQHIEIEKFLSMSDEASSFVIVTEAVNWITLEDSPIAKQFKVFLDKHGHRSSREFDVMFKTWGMDPVQLISPLKACMNQKSQIKLSKKTLDEALAQLKCNLTSTQKKSLENLVPKSRKFVAFREQAKSLMIRTIHQYRKEFWKLAKLMVKEGRLPDPELLMFMTKLEISNLLKTRSSAIIQRAIRRRRLFSKLNDAVYPEIIFGLPESVCTAVSQGTVKGKARVITKVEDAKEIVPGEILVTTATDIAWSPYFPSLSGVVTEIGGLVSHGAVVAREYGIPCVVGVQQVTSILKSGDLIFLDAKKGQVSKLESE